MAGRIDASCCVTCVWSPGYSFFDLSLLRASLVAQMVKNLSARQDTWVQSLGWEDLLEKGMATQFNILAWRISWTEGPGRLCPWDHGVTESLFNWPPDTHQYVHLPDGRDQKAYPHWSWSQTSQDIEQNKRCNRDKGKVTISGRVMINKAMNYSIKLTRVKSKELLPYIFSPANLNFSRKNSYHPPFQ